MPSRSLGVFSLITMGWRRGGVNLREGDVVKRNGIYPARIAEDQRLRTSCDFARAWSMVLLRPTGWQGIEDAAGRVFKWTRGYRDIAEGGTRTHTSFWLTGF